MRYLLLALLAGSWPLQAAEETLEIPRAAQPPNLDDYVAGVPADAGVEIEDFRQNAPGDGEPVSLETRAYLSYDDQHLHVVFVCKDDPKLLRARIARREDIFGDEGVQIFLDTYLDKQRAFVFAANPYGVQLDSKLTEGLGYDFNFDTQWSSDGRITADGYVVTMSIPFKSLRFERAPRQRWGIAVGRIIPRANEFSYWPYITERKEGLVPQFAVAEIEHEIKPGRNIQVIPHVSYRDTSALEFADDGTPRIGSQQKLEGGVDAKFVIKDSLALDLTVNPDFSEVESDEPQVIVNQRYEVRFPEKRPFFLENAGFFGTPVTLFFSRRIADPEYGARLTGRVGRWALGGLLIDDEQAGALLPPNDPDVDETGRIAVARVQRDVGTQSNVGVLLTQRDVGEHVNRTYGVDTRVKLDDNWTFSGQAVGSDSDEGGGIELEDELWFAQFTRSGRNFSYDAQWIDIGRDFESELGFVPRTDIEQFYQSAEYLWQFPDAPWLINLGPEVVAYYTWNTDGEKQDWSVDAGFELNGLNLTKFEARWIESYERFAGLDFRKDGFVLSATSEPFKWLSFDAKLSAGEGINYIPAAGLEPFLGDARQAQIGFALKPHPQFRIDQTFIWDELRTRDPIAGRDEDENVFRGTLARTRFSYQLSRFWSLRLILDYAGITPDSELIALDRGKRLTTDFLVSYVLRPGTTLYLGYTDRRENLRLFGDPRVLERTDDLDLQTGEQVFVKLSYLFDF